MASQRRTQPVKVAVVGDSQVGKTSLVIALANESFPDMCPPVVPPASLPAEMTPEDVPFHAIDTSSRPEDRAVLEQTCVTADVILLLFEAGSSRSLKNVTKHWMPLLLRLGVHVPVILVSSKQDLAEQEDEELSASAQPILRKFPQVEACLRCSAKRLVNVGDVFHTALKAVVNPVAPLFDPQAEGGDGAMTPMCIRALKRIFVMNDRDKDGALSDNELNHFQVHCFSAPLQPEELSGVKRVVADQMEKGVNSSGLTLPGFLFLHALFIERGRLDTVWAVLRTYGYSNDLSLSPEILSEINFSHAPDQVVEMTDVCTAFFTQMSVEFDKDGDKLLSTIEQADMFSTAPSEPWEGEGFKQLLVAGEGRALTLQGFLSKWAYTTAIDPAKTLAYIRYLGYEGSAAGFFSISRPRRQERKQEQILRSTLRVAAFLAKGAGKGLLLRGLSGNLEDDASAANKSVAAGAVIYENSDIATQRTLILYEQEAPAVAALERNTEQLGSMDAAAFTFDAASLDSFREAHGLLQRVAAASGNTMACLLVAIEDEAGMHEDVVRACGDACAALNLRQPVTLARDSRSDMDSVLQALLRAIEKPEKNLAIPLTPSLRASRKQQQNLKWAALFGVAGVVGALSAYAIYKAYQGSSQPRTDASSVPISSEPPITTPTAK